MAGGDPNKRVCEDCGRSWHSTAFHRGDNHVCPECDDRLVLPDDPHEESSGKEE